MTKNLVVFVTLLLLVFLGLWLRLKNIEDYNIVFDFDQYEDQFYTYTVAVDRNLAIIGRAVYGDPRLHHGVFYYYYNLIPFLISSGNPLVSVYWNIFFNTSVALILFILAKSLFRDNLTGLIAAIVAVSSFEFIKFSNWMTIDTVSIFLVPLFFLGLWSYYLKKRWGLPLATSTLGLSIQSDLSFLYLIPIILIYWVVLKPKNPGWKLFTLSLFSFLVTTSTLILTEIKLKLAGVKTLLDLSKNFEGAQISFVDRLKLIVENYWANFSNNLFPQNPQMGIYLFFAVLGVILYNFWSKKTAREEKIGIKFLLLFLFAPFITLLVGYHDKPWFLIGLSPAIALATGYAVSKLKNVYLMVAIIFVIISTNSIFILNRPYEAYKLFNDIYDLTSYLKFQVQVVDYTYGQSAGLSFAINAVTYPLYYNGMWASLYNWYGKEKFGYLPGWLGGDQLHPYDLLPKAKNDEKFIYMIISETPRIPEIYKNKGRIWAKNFGRLLEEKKFEGFTILKLESRDGRS